MKTTNRALPCLSVFLLLAFAAGCRAEDCVRRPAVAGAFYPAQPEELARMVDGFLDRASPPAVTGGVRVLIVPHAGYVYSGDVAAHGFKTLKGRSYKTVVLVGNSHKEGFQGASIYAKGAFRTPLGEIAVDEAMAERIMAASDLIRFRESTHAAEHSLEVELPFLARSIGEFKIVPILLGTESTMMSRVLADALARAVDEHTLVVVSTDMSHYPSYEDANFVDGKVAAAIVAGDVDNLERTLRQLERMGVPNEATCLCGEGAVKAGLFLAQKIGARNAQLLKYANSGDTAGSKQGVVGYSAIAFAAPDGAAAPAGPAEAPAGEGVLNEQEQKALLELARKTVEAFVTTGKRPEWTGHWPGLRRPLGAFVTLKKNGELRGCIGRFEPNQPLSEVVQDMAIAAATQDGRFPPVGPGELGAIEYEISVLSPLRKVGSWKEIEIGKHGVEVQKGWRRGVFLPQVATETGWDLETFLSNLCAHKAGLPADAWKDPGTDLYVFTAQVFHESD